MKMNRNDQGEYIPGLAQIVIEQAKRRKGVDQTRSMR